MVGTSRIPLCSQHALIGGQARARIDGRSAGKRSIVVTAAGPASRGAGMADHERRGRCQRLARRANSRAVNSAAAYTDHPPLSHAASAPARRIEQDSIIDADQRFDVAPLILRQSGRLKPAVRPGPLRSKVPRALEQTPQEQTGLVYGRRRRGMFVFVTRARINYQNWGAVTNYQPSARGEQTALAENH